MSDPAGERREGTEAASVRHWEAIARQWRLLGPPLRLSPQDVGICWDAAGDLTRRRGAPRVLLLGVTPELYRLPWPDGTDFLAVDHSQAMIDAVWTGPRDDVLCADWLDMALPDGSRDVVFCDGGLQLLTYPDEQRRLAGVLKSVLSRGGLCILRLFVPPAERESPDAVLRDVVEGRVPSLDALKLRLWAALMEGPEQGVAVRAVWRAVHEAVPDLAGLAAEIGWPVERMLAINSYRHSDARYFIVTVDRVSELFCADPGGFEVCSVRVPSYELGEQCPTVVLERR